MGVVLEFCRLFFPVCDTYLQYPQEEACSKATWCCRRQVTDCGVARRIEPIELMKT